MQRPSATWPEKGNQAASDACREFNAIRADFVKHARAPDLPAAAFKLAHLIAYEYMNTASRSTFVGQERLAKDLGGITTRHVQRLLVILKACGLEIEAGQGRGKASTYRITEGQEGRKQPAEKATFPDRKRRHFETKKGDIQVAPTLEENQQADARASALGRENAREERAELPLFGPGALRAPAVEVESKQASEASQEASTAGEIAAAAEPQAGSTDFRTEIRAAPVVDEPATKTETAEVASLDDERAFRELRGLWQRGWAADDSPRSIAIQRAAFRKALKEGADPEAIIAGAKVHIAAADAPRFLHALPKWFEGRGWEAAPPAKAAQRANPERRRAGWRGRYRKPDTLKLILAGGGFVENSYGEMVWPEDEQ